MEIEMTLQFVIKLLLLLLNDKISQLSIIFHDYDFKKKASRCGQC